MEERKNSLTNFIISLTKAFPATENSSFYVNDTGYQPYRSSQNTGNSFGNFGTLNQIPQSEQKPEIKKSLFQRIFGSKH